MTDRPGTVTPAKADPAAAAPEHSPDGSGLDARSWDGAVRTAGGHLLQSWRWGAFKGRHGWVVERVRVCTPAGVGLAQVLFKQRGPVSFGYLPRGPVLSTSDPDLAQTLFAAIDQTCRRRRALGLIVEPDVALPFTGRLSDAGFVPGPAPIQPTRTVKVPLLADDALIERMHPKTRYNIRLARRRGVTTTHAAADEPNLAIFHGLLQDTAQRNEFGVHTPAYYADFLRLFGDDSVLIFAAIDGQPVAGLIAARFGDEGIYMYGASSTQHRASGAGFFVQFEAMRWARAHGCTRYDLWGIPAQDPPSSESADGTRLASSRGDDRRGLYEFKVRFGGDILGYPPPLERRYRPLLAALARRVYRPGG